MPLWYELPTPAKWGERVILRIPVGHVCRGQHARANTRDDGALAPPRPAPKSAITLLWLRQVRPDAAREG
jgi:hypothetical protein